MLNKPDRSPPSPGKSAAAKGLASVFFFWPIYGFRDVSLAFSFSAAGTYKLPSLGAFVGSRWCLHESLAGAAPTIPKIPLNRNPLVSVREQRIRLTIARDYRLFLEVRKAPVQFAKGRDALSRVLWTHISRIISGGAFKKNNKKNTIGQI